MFFSWELNVPKLLVVEEVGGANIFELIFLWVREDEIYVNLGNDKDEQMQELMQPLKRHSLISMVAIFLFQWMKQILLLVMKL